jgi:PAS domain-containing protein
MANKLMSENQQLQLRASAVSRLAGDADPMTGLRNQAAAFQALYDMALSPATAPSALALLHELQVHQVELDLQADELQRTRSEIEIALARQTLIYDVVPVGLLTIDLELTVSELNHMGARVFGVPQGTLAGFSLDALLDTDSVRGLRTALDSLVAGVAVEPCAIELTLRDNPMRTLHASLARDPGGFAFLLAVLPVDPRSSFA